MCEIVSVEFLCVHIIHFLFILLVGAKLSQSNSFEKEKLNSAFRPGK